MSVPDPDALADAPIITAVEGLMLEVYEVSVTQYMPALQVHLLSVAGDHWTQTMLVNRSMIAKLQASVLPSLVEFLDDHTPEKPHDP